MTKNYAKTVECLTQLGFLLPEANQRTIEKLVEDLMSFELSQLKEMDPISIKREINDIVQALPIQVPTRFVFLGRSFVAVEGIVQQLIAEDEWLELIKPVFIDWLNKEGNQKWSIFWQWIQALPVFKMVRSVQEFLQLPQKLEDVKEIEQRREFQFRVFESHKKHVFQLSLVGVVGIGVGIVASHTLVLYLSSGLTALSGIGFMIVTYKQKKWLKYMQEIRK